jgi:hypothetical protein
MSLETASYIANLVATNPDGGDQRSTADDHLRLIKAALVRTFPKLDGAISLSQTQVTYIGDLSASAQLQLNTLRDGPATANFAVEARHAQSASTASNIGTIPAASVARTDATNGFATPQCISDASRVDLILNAGGTRGVDSLDLINDAAGFSYLWQRGNKPLLIGTNAVTRIQINADGTITIAGLITGTITNAQTASNATNATNATTATTATTATLATTCISASSAQTLAGYSAAESAVADSIVKRSSSGYVYATYFSQSSGVDNQSIGHIACMTNLDGFWRPNTVANLGAYLEARNITGRTGITKTLSTSAPSGGSNGDIWYKY